MTKYLALKIIGILTAMTIILWVLFISARLPNKELNGFTRNWNNDSVILTNYIQIDTPLSMIGGVSNEYIYIKSERPNWILEIKKDLSIKDSVLLNINVSDLLVFANNLYIDSPMIYLHANNLKSIIRSRVRSKEVELIKLKTDIFTKSFPISKDKIIVRAFDSTQTAQVFQIVDLKSGEVIKEKLIIENQFDSGFSSDGMFSYDSVSDKIFYIQFYNNNLLCLDTNLSISYKASTIDTISSNDLQIKKVNSSLGAPSLMPSASRKLVNKSIFLNKQYLFIESALKADNDNLHTFQNTTTIDVYYLNDGKYVKSISIPHSRKNKKAISYLIDNKQLIVLYKNAIAIYKIPSLLGT